MSSAMKSDPMGMVTKTWTIFNHLGPCYVHSKVLAQEGKRETASRCQTGISNPMADLKLPKGVTYLQALTAVNAKAFLSESDFGQFCRKHGYLASTVDAWAELFSKHPERWISGTVLNCTPIGRVWLNPENGQLEEKRLPGTA